MIILHAAPITWGRIGGLHVSIPALVEAQNRLEGVDAALLVTTPSGPTPLGLKLPLFEHTIRVDRGRLNLPSPFDRPDLVIFHSTYIPAHARIARTLRRAAVPYIICPRGGMTHFAQQHHGWKKKLGNWLFFNRLVARARALNCLTDGEAKATRGWNRPTFIVGNGIDLPEASELAVPGRSDTLRLIFIGRLHIQYKGLDMLLRACRLTRDELLAAKATVELYGPDYRGSRTTLKKQIDRLQLTDVVALGNPVLGRAKAALLGRADIFLHPSRSEGHPMAVLEALAYGLPCLLTPVTNVADDVVAAAAGWQVEPSAEAIAAGIRTILATDRERLREVGENARGLAKGTYAWSKIATRSLQHYRNWAA